MAELFLVLPAHMALGQSHDSEQAAIAAAVARTDRDRIAHVVVRQVALAKPSNAPRADVVVGEAVGG